MSDAFTADERKALQAALRRDDDATAVACFAALADAREARQRGLEARPTLRGPKTFAEPHRTKLEENERAEALQELRDALALLSAGWGAYQAARLKAATIPGLEPPDFGLFVRERDPLSGSGGIVPLEQRVRLLQDTTREPTRTLDELAAACNELEPGELHAKGRSGRPSTARWEAWCLFDALQAWEAAAVDPDDDYWRRAFEMARTVFGFTTRKFARLVKLLNQAGWVSGTVPRVLYR